MSSERSALAERLVNITSIIGLGGKRLEMPPVEIPLAPRRRTPRPR
jgi:hypothetical protein